MGTQAALGGRLAQQAGDKGLGWPGESIWIVKSTRDSSNPELTASWHVTQWRCARSPRGGHGSAGSRTSPPRRGKPHSPWQPPVSCAPPQPAPAATGLLCLRGFIAPGVSCTWNHSVWLPSPWFACTTSRGSSVPQRTRQRLLSFYGQIIFHHVDRPPCVNPGVLLPTCGLLRGVAGGGVEGFPGQRRKGPGAGGSAPTQRTLVGCTCARPDTEGEPSARSPQGRLWPSQAPERTCCVPARSKLRVTLRVPGGSSVPCVLLSLAPDR